MKNEIYKSRGTIFTARFFQIAGVALMFLFFVGLFLQCVGALP
jgi:hypothetical protein